MSRPTVDAEPMVDIVTTINGRPVAASVPARQSLVDWLRQDQGLTGSHVGCEHGVCGACTVVVDGRCVRGCLLLAAQADRAVIETIEGAIDSGRLAALQQSFLDRAALQCGFCTPAMLLTAAELLDENPSPSRALDPRGALGQLLPLHGLPRHRRCHRGCGRDKERMRNGRSSRFRRRRLPLRAGRHPVFRRCRRPARP